MRCKKTNDNKHQDKKNENINTKVKNLNDAKTLLPGGNVKKSKKIDKNI